LLTSSRAGGGGPLGGVGPLTSSRAGGGGPLGGVGPVGGAPMALGAGGAPMGGAPMGGAPMGGAAMGGAAMGGATMGGAQMALGPCFEDAPMLRVMRCIAIAAVPADPLAAEPIAAERLAAELLAAELLAAERLGASNPASERAVSAWNSKVRRSSALKASVTLPTTSSIDSWSQSLAL